ncbi:MAG: site-2 protease family protein [bacterium]|nr:site-2 protease family protein [bacterium]
MIDIRIIIMLILFFSIIIHEYAHGWMALRSGDPTAKHAGRLTLNPIPHIDMMGTIIVPAMLVASGTSFIFGWAKPVPVNPMNFRNPRIDNLKVSAAGPASNLILAFILTIAAGILPKFTAMSSSNVVLTAMSYGIYINILLAVFNLIPLHPLDGSHVLEYFVPGSFLGTYRRIQKTGPVILMLLIASGFLLNRPILFSIIGPPTEAIFSFYQKILSLFGV